MPSLTPEEIKRVIGAIEFITKQVALAEQARADAERSDDGARAVDSASTAGFAAYEMANLKLSACEDYLHATAALLAGGIPRYACYVLLRSALEAAAGAYWLMEPGLNDAERQARSITAQYLNAMATKRADPKQDMKERLAEFQQAAAELGAAPVLDERNQLVGFGKRRPSITEQVMTMPTLNHKGMKSGRHVGEWAFTTLSGFAHAEMWAIMHGRRVLDSDETYSTLELTPMVSTLMDFVSIVTAAHDNALAAFIGLSKGTTAAWTRPIGERPDL
jgi:hypothetical protein